MTTSPDSARQLLRHTVATVAYRGSKALRGAPAEFANSRIGEKPRTPSQILAHMGDLFDWAFTIAQGKQEWHDSTPLPWSAEVERFFAAIKKFDDFLASSEPLHVSAESLFQGPISANVTPDGKLLVQSHTDEAIPNVILFERRGDKVGFRIAGALQDQLLLASPALTDSVDALGRELEGLLVAQGLYQDEAHAMVETWRTSWFEEGTRLLYIVPTSFVNSVVPLSISPAPSQTVRVFVGRLEVVTPETERSVERAIAAHDTVTLAKYGRFLEPILQEMMKKERDTAKLRLLQQSLNSVYSTVVANNLHKN